MIYPKYLPEKYYENNDSVVLTTNISQTVSGEADNGSSWVVNFQRVGDLVVANAIIANISCPANSVVFVFVRLPLGLENYAVDRFKRRFIFTPQPFNAGVVVSLRKSSGAVVGVNDVGLSDNNIWEIRIDNNTTAGVRTVEFIMTGLAINPYNQ